MLGIQTKSQNSTKMQWIHRHLQVPSKCIEFKQNLQTPCQNQWNSSNIANSARIQPASSQHPTMHNKLCYPSLWTQSLGGGLAKRLNNTSILLVYYWYTTSILLLLYVVYLTTWRIITVEPVGETPMIQKTQIRPLMLQKCKHWRIRHLMHNKCNNLRIRRLAHQKGTKMMNSTPEALIALENMQTDRDIIAAEPCGGTVLLSQKNHALTKYANGQVRHRRQTPRNRRN
jgi:hypothetical protein